MADIRKHDAPGYEQPSGRAVAVTPNDSTDLANGPTRALYVGGAGNLYVDMELTGSNVAFIGVTAGSILPIRVSRVRSTSTTAANIVALY